MCSCKTKFQCSGTLLTTVQVMPNVMGISKATHRGGETVAYFGDIVRSHGIPSYLMAKCVMRKKIQFFLT